MFDFIIGIFIGVAITVVSINKIALVTYSDPTLSEMEIAYNNHKNYSPLVLGPPVIYKKNKYVRMYHEMMVEFINKMMIEEHDGFNPLTIFN